MPYNQRLPLSRKVIHRSQADSSGNGISAPAVVQRAPGDRYKGSLDEGLFVKILGTGRRLSISEEDAATITSNLIEFTEGETDNAINIVNLDIPLPALDKSGHRPASATGLPKALPGSTGYRDAIGELLSSKSENVITHEPRFQYDPEKGVSIGQVLPDPQAGLPTYTKIAKKISDDRWDMQTQGPGNHEWKPADGTFDFVLQSPQGNLKMIGRQEGGAGHSSFGSSALMAGEVKFHGGVLMEWSTRSGHLMPPEILAYQSPLPKSKLIGYRSLDKAKNKLTAPEIELVEEKKEKEGSDWKDELTELISAIRNTHAEAIATTRATARKKDIAEQSYILTTREMIEFKGRQKDAGNVLSNTVIKSYM